MLVQWFLPYLCINKEIFLSKRKIWGKIWKYDNALQTTNIWQVPVSLYENRWDEVA